MSKKFYAIGFEHIKSHFEKNKKQLQEPLNHQENYDILYIFGKSHYELAILNFFKNHSILKQTTYSQKLLEYFCSDDFIAQTMKHIGVFDKIPKEKQKEKSFLRWYFYSCVYIFYEKCFDKNIEEKLFERNFLHFSATINPPTNTQINPEQIVKNILKPKTPKESFGEDENGVFFKIIFDSKICIDLRGSSIKTLRKKAYKEFLKMVLDNGV